MFQQDLQIKTQGRGTYEVTSPVREIIKRSGVTIGLCHLFIYHTSASLIICENAAPEVRQDLETFMARVVPDGDHEYLHLDEGPDDMPAHIRTILTHNDLTIPIRSGHLNLGTWQGIYVWEHRTHAHTRQLTISVTG